MSHGVGKPDFNGRCLIPNSILCFYNIDRFSCSELKERVVYRKGPLKV